MKIFSLKRIKNPEQALTRIERALTQPAPGIGISYHRDLPTKNSVFSLCYVQLLLEGLAQQGWG
jgi:hypothetical protein